MSHFLAALTSSALTPYYSFRAQEICSTSHLSIASRPAAGNTCVSMTKMRILGQKSRQNDRFQAEFSKFFRKPQGSSYGCSIMDFGVLELWEAALNDPGMILNEFQKPQKIMIFFKISVKILIYIQAFQYVHRIDLRFVMWNIHQNNIF